MLFVFECPTCKARIEADATASGRQAHCPQCANLVAVPLSRVDCGTTLGGFRLDRRLGKGGMGEVFLGTQLSVGRQVAVKVLPPGFAADREAVQRFLHEGRLAARLDHANIVAVHAAGEDNGHYYLAMAYVEGESLDQRLKREGALPEHEALTIVRTVADALAYAWDEFQLLHRDLKPANLMLDRRGRVFLMDLGLAKTLGEESGMTVSGAILGTPHYMSPEQATGSTQLSVQTDIYALGATLYHLVVGAPPFTGDSALKVLNQHVHEPLPPPRSRNPRVGEACSQVVTRMMAKKPEQRYSGWRELSADLERVLTGAVPLQPAVPAAVSKADLAHQAQAALARQHQAQARSLREGAVTTVPARPAWRSPWLLGLAAAAAVLVVLGVALALRGHGGAAAPQAERGSPTGPAGPTSPTRPTGPTGPAQPAAATAPQAAAVTPPTAPAQSAAATAVPAPAQPVPPDAPGAGPVTIAAGARPVWDRITLPHTGNWALEFDGAAAGVTAPGLVWAESGSLTIEAVFRPESTAPAFVAGRSAGAGAMWLGTRDQQIVARRRLPDGTYESAAAPLVPHRYVHVAGTWDGNSLRLYVNGALAGTSSPASRSTDSSKAPNEVFAIARHAGAFLKGTVETVRVSKGTRYTEDFDLEQALPLKPDKDTLCLLDFEEGEGDVAKDSSGHGNHGQIKGARWRRQWPCPVPEARLRDVEAALQQENPRAAGLVLQAAGRPQGVCLTLDDPELENLTAIAGLPVQELTIGPSRLADLSALRGLPLKTLAVHKSPVRDLKGLKGLPLRWLSVRECPVPDLTPLTGMRLVFLGLFRTPVKDLTPLRGMPLRGIGTCDTAITDLSPLRGMPLLYLEVWSPGEKAGFEVIRDMPLRFVGVGPVPDYSPLLACPNLEIVQGPKDESSGAAVQQKLRGRVRFNVPAAEWLQEVYGGLMPKVAEEMWLDTAAAVAADDLGGLAKLVLAGRANEALQRWRERGDALGAGLSSEQRQTLTSLFEALAGMDRQILASLKADVGKTVEIELAKEKITGEVRDVTADGVQINQVIRQGQGTARLGRPVKLAEFSIAERLRRLGGGDAPETNLQRGLLALEASRPDTARKLFAKAGSPLGEALVAELKARQAEAREGAAEQAVIELLRQVSTTLEFDDEAKAVASIRKRIGGDLKRLQAARKTLAAFDKEWGGSNTGKEWGAVVRRGLAIPIAGDTPLQVQDLGMELVPIAAGEFMMGLAKGGWSGEQAIHRVSLSKPFWMGKYEVTQAEFQTVMGRNPSRFKGPRRPVEMVSWLDGTAFAQKLTERERAAGRLPDGYEFRLPTEAEWEYACRAGTGGEYPGELDEIAWYNKTSGGQSHDVGQKKPNAWGLYDMCGNVFEWCYDWYSETYYARSPASDPVCLQQEKPQRMSRGGSWLEDPNRCLSGFRYPAWGPEVKLDQLGFRIVLGPPLPAP